MAGQNPYELPVEIFEAERVYLYVQQALSDFEGVAANTKVEAIRDAIMHQIVYRLTTWCVAGRIEDSVLTEHFSYPDGVWQTFKEKFMPHWFVGKFPVRKITKEIRKTVNHYFVCPHVKTDAQGKHIQFMATGTRFASMMGGYPRA